MAPDPLDRLRATSPLAEAPPVPSMAALDRAVRLRRLRLPAALGAVAVALALAAGLQSSTPPADPALARDAAVEAGMQEAVESLAELSASPTDDLPNAELVAMLDPFGAGGDPVNDPLDGLWAEGDL
jgi:hypothetical protein